MYLFDTRFSKNIVLKKINLIEKRKGQNKPG